VKALDGELVSLDQLENMRGDPEAYETFIDTICATVVGQDKYKRAATSDIKEWMTESSEAFALLLMENYHDNATSIAEIWSENPRMTRTSLSVEGADVGKYTASGKGAKRNQGWNKEGIKRYNELFQLVKEDREKNPSFDDYFKKRKKGGMSKAEEQRKRKREANRTGREEGWMVADDNLSSDEDDDNEGTVAPQHQSRAEGVEDQGGDGSGSEHDGY